jgi:hypothetical protein
MFSNEMSLNEAISEARKRWGYSGAVATMEAYQVKFQDGQEERLEYTRQVGVIVGKEMEVYGEGVSWEEAFKMVDERQTYIAQMAKRRTDRQR